MVGETFAGIIRSDRWFTIPGGAGIVVTGFALASAAKVPVLGTGWVFWPIVLFSVSGAIFGAFLAPLQRRIRDLARAGGPWEAYQPLYRRWEWWGLLALATPVAAFVIMVFRPLLPGL